MKNFLLLSRVVFLFLFLFFWSAYLDAAASAYAHAGDFKRAAKFQEKAVENSTRSMNRKLVEERRRKLELYKQGKAE